MTHDQPLRRDWDAKRTKGSSLAGERDANT